MMNLSRMQAVLLDMDGTLVDSDGAAAQHRRERECVDVADVPAARGAHGLLAELDGLGLPWAVVTSADIRLAQIRLAAARITPALLVTIDDVRHGKPDLGEPY